MKLKNDIYVYEWTNPNENNCNSYFIGGNVQALIDPGLTGYVPNLLDQMSADGIEKEDIRYVINTHSHPVLSMMTPPFANGPSGDVLVAYERQVGLPRLMSA